MIRIAALAFLLTLLAACANSLPKPVNANGSVSPTVTVAEAKITYTNTANAATGYVTKCHAAPTTIGCSDAVIAQIKAANDKAFASVNAAENAVKTLPAGATGIDAAIADMNAAIAFLQGLIPTTP